MYKLYPSQNLIVVFILFADVISVTRVEIICMEDFELFFTSKQVERYFI